MACDGDNWQALLNTMMSLQARDFRLPPRCILDLQGSAWLLKMRPIAYPETSVRNYHSALRNVAKKRRPQPSSFIQFGEFSY
jgi:hypothetical protein